MKLLSILILLTGLNQSLRSETYEAIITHYCNCQKCCSWIYNKEGTPVFNYGKLKGVKKIVGKTASGKMSRANRTLAVPSFIKFGTKIYIGGKLLGIAEDRGGAIIGSKKLKKIKIDVYVESHKKALQLGIYKTKVEL